MLDILLSIYPNIPALAQLLAAGVFIVVGVYSIKQRVYITYILTNPATAQIYIGRTSGFGDIQKIIRRRLYNHKYFKAGFTEVEVDKMAQGKHARLAIRGREQQLLDHRGGLDNPQIANKIRAVSRINISKKAYSARSKELFGEL